jgi:kynureninase
MRWQGSAAEPGWYEFRGHFQAVNRIGRFLLSEIDIGRQVEIPGVLRIGAQQGCSVLRARS